MSLSENDILVWIYTVMVYTTIGMKLTGLFLWGYNLVKTRFLWSLWWLWAALWMGGLQKEFSDTLHRFIGT